MYAIILSLALQAQLSSAAANGLPCIGNVCASYYENIPGGFVHNLKNAAKFPDNPDRVLSLSSLDIPPSIDENYGVMIQAWIKAPKSGNYIFSTLSDDSSEVWLSTAAGEKAASEAEMVKVVELVGCCQKITGIVNVNLVEGESYYLQAYMKEAYGHDYFKIGMTEVSTGIEYFPIADTALGFVDPTCTTTGSEFTEKMLVKMDAAKDKFGDCADDIASVASTLGHLGRISQGVDLAADTMAKIMDKVNDLSDRLLRPIHQGGVGIVDIAGKIPKVGIFIKMGFKVVEEVIDGLDPLAQSIAGTTERIDKAVKLMGKGFTGVRAVSTPTWAYLAGSHKMLEAAHACGQATGYKCGSKAGFMELKNEWDYPDASERLDAIRDVGATCHQVLNPIDTVLKELKEFGEKLMNQLLAPLIELLERVEDFISRMSEQIEKFMQMLSDSDEAQCALEIFEPVTDTINLLTCPIDEVAGFIMHHTIDALIESLNRMIKIATTLGINAAVEAIVPDELMIFIPDFTEILPVQFWMDTCESTAIAFPGYADTLGEIVELSEKLPMVLTGAELKDEILSDPLEGIDLNEIMDDYQSACETAWNEMGGDFEHCENVLDKVADALVDAQCQISVGLHDVEVAAVEAQQTVVDAALKHFQDAQREFAKAQDDLRDVQDDLTSALSSVQNAKNDCPSCRCGGCGADIGCHIEGIWCCPAKNACLIGLDIASGGVLAAKGTVDAASSIVQVAQVAYDSASRDFARQKQVLKHMRNQAETQRQAMELVCNPPMYEMVKSGDCASNGHMYITDRRECILAGKLLGVQYYTNPSASGNRQKACGTWEGDRILHFNTQTSGSGSNGWPILQTAGVHSGQSSWQICKRRGTTINAEAYTCVGGQGPSGGSKGSYNLNNRDLCAEKCNSVSSCIGFDYTGYSRGDACRIYYSSSGARVGNTGTHNRQWCTINQASTAILPPAAGFLRKHANQYCAPMAGDKWNKKNEAECMQECLADASCVAITVLPDRGAGASCFTSAQCDELLVSDIGTYTLHKFTGTCDAYSGRDVASGFVHHAQSGAYGVTTDAACRERCNNAEGCRAWVRQPSTNRCWLTTQTGIIPFMTVPDRNSGYACRTAGRRLETFSARLERTLPGQDNELKTPIEA